jgi:flagellar biogenesis protein FliO
MRKLLSIPILISNKILLADDFSTPDSEISSQITSMIGTLVLMIAGIIFLAFMVKKFMNSRIQTINNLNAIKILEKRSLSPKSHLYLIEVQGKQLLISESQMGLQSIAEISTKEKPIDQKVNCQETLSFAKLLKSKLKLPLQRPLK